MRTKPEKDIQINESIPLSGNLVTRFNLAGQLGVSFTGMRNLYDVLGYPTVLQFRDFLAQYFRHGIAKAIINRPIQRTWKGDVLIIESDDDKTKANKIAFDNYEKESKSSKKKDVKKSEKQDEFQPENK